MQVFRTPIDSDRPQIAGCVSHPALGQ